jgi:hypothetical protein
LKVKEIKIIASNGVRENIAIVLNNNNYEGQQAYYERNKDKVLDYFHQHYLENRNKILEKKKERNKQPDVKQHNPIYHKQYYQLNKEELKRKNKERYLRNRKHETKMSRT